MAEGTEEIVRSGVFAPIFGGDGHLVDIKLIQKLVARNEAAASGWVHDLNIFAVRSPNDYKVRDAVGLHHDGDGGECAGFREQHVVHGEHDLFRFHAEFVGDNFQSVNGSAIDIGLAGFAEASVVDVDTEAFEEAFEGGGSAIHVGGLDHFGDEE